jgi:hypothetical protein
MQKSRQPMALSLLFLVLLLISGCAAPKPANLTNQQVAGVTEKILNALDATDYQVFTQDFSETMKAAFTQTQFEALGSQLQKASGSFVSLGSPSLTNNQGYAAYRFPAKYTNETVYVTLTFLVGGQKVEGLWLDSLALRKAVK